MSKEEEKYLIALGNLQNMAIDNTKGSKAVEICTNDIRAYVERLNNIIDGMEKFFKYEFDNEVKPLNSYKVSVWTICLDKLNELKGDNK